MNKEELKELAATLNGIADGKEWEIIGSHATSRWKTPMHTCPYEAMRLGWRIRLKPWQLPQPPDGMQWHRDDWTEEMLPSGYRPSLLDEAGDGEVSNDCGKTWKVDGKPSIPVRKWYGSFYRTKRPLPQPQQPQQPDPYAELKAAHAAGKKLQRRPPGYTTWQDCSVTDRSQDPYCFLCEPECYRIKPEQQKVPLGPSDVPPASAFTAMFGYGYCTPSLVDGDGCYFASRQESQDKLVTWPSMVDGWKINRSIPLTGKWNPEAWEPCYKLIDTP